MKVYCHECSILVGEIVSGSKMRKGIIYLCTECHGTYKTLKSLKDYEKGVGGGGMPDFLNDLMKGMKK